MTPLNSANLNANESNGYHNTTTNNNNNNDMSLNVTAINSFLNNVTAEDLNRARPMGRGALMNGHTSKTKQFQLLKSLKND